MALVRLITYTLTFGSYHTPLQAPEKQISRNHVDGCTLPTPYRLWDYFSGSHDVESGWVRAQWTHRQIGRLVTRPSVDKMQVLQLPSRQKKRKEKYPSDQTCRPNQEKRRIEPLREDCAPKQGEKSDQHPIALLLLLREKEKEKLYLSLLLRS
jgi:hypothetical protein